MPARPEKVMLRLRNRRTIEIDSRYFWQKFDGGRMSDETAVLEPEMAEVETDGTVNLHEVVCSDCGEPMDEHGCPNGTAHPAAAPVVVTTRSTGPRKKADEHPPCAHCGGRIHWNNGAALVNFECMYRQYLMATGKISDPSARLPVFTSGAVKDFEMWVDDQGEDFKYGNMESAGGGGGTYSAIRPKAPPKPVKTEEEKAEAKRLIAEKRKAERAAAKAAKSISDVADDVAGAEDLDAIAGEELAIAEEGSLDELESEMPSKPKRERKPKSESSEKPVSMEDSRAKRRAERQKRLKEMQGR
jgi:hypothetical protein